MKVIVCGLIVAAVLAVPATASAPTLRSLQRQIEAARAMIAVQQNNLKQLRADETNQNDRITCNYAVGSDNLNLVWHTLNLIAQYDGLTAQPDFPRYDDAGACSRLGVTRVR